jgi:putative transposase
VNASSDISIDQQLALVGLNKSTYYYKPVEVDELTLQLLKIIDKVYTDYPTFGTRKMRDFLYNKHQYKLNRKRIRRLYDILGICAIYQKPRTTIINTENKVFPYLLRGVEVDRTDQVWSTDITYCQLKQGFAYLGAIIDWYSRRVLDWQLDISMEAELSVELLQRTINTHGSCEIFNTDQGSQYTSRIFTECVLDNNMKMSMDGRGRWADNVWIERLWRTVKYECLYLHEFATVKEMREILARFFLFYNTERPHQSLGGRTPEMVYRNIIF